MSLKLIILIIKQSNINIIQIKRLFMNIYGNIISLKKLKGNKHDTFRYSTLNIQKESI